MFNYGAIDKTPTVSQVEAIIKYMDSDKENKYNFNFMMGMKRVDTNHIILDLNNAHIGVTYDIIFSNENEILSFKKSGQWIS